ncbi:hypothetical protein JOC94_000787 [Bacillus thermophilus]|uniref:Phospholipase A2 domain-containing protein n=1 Tax=Siminovitchia thermophila TaxID=1245522 RepID=A0ABS2R2F3_9BACI|nr:hypothetical protein [Siminovitchia thermophila]MBM7713817.1 hypothetical protein [Siminovitchia thermophila]ONK21373.1 hypothetical protein BLX87_22080 [Bacillus sp. VT-16-64]
MFIKSNKVDIATKNLLTEELNNHEDFALLVAEIQKHHKTLSEKQKDIFELEFAEDEAKQGVKVNVVFFTLTDEVIIEGMKVGDKLHVKAYFSAENDEGEKVFRQAVVEGGNVEIESEMQFDPEKFMFVNELKNPQGVEEQKVTPQAWYEGCLVFYNSGNGKTYKYRYCGAKCSGKNFTQTPINALDKCCQAHDRCYKNFGKGDNGCDKNLQSCADRTSDPGWWMVSEFARRCSLNELSFC